MADSSEAGRYLSSLDEINEHLVALGYESRSALRPGGIGFGARVNDLPTRLELSWNREHGMLHVQLGVPMKVPEGEHVRGAVAISELNNKLAFPGFQLRKGLVFGVQAYSNHDGTVSTRVVENLVALCVETVDKYFAELSDALTMS